jgi:hypothetical protein
MCMRVCECANEEGLWGLGTLGEVCVYVHACVCMRQCGRPVGARNAWGGVCVCACVCVRVRLCVRPVGARNAWGCVCVCA